MAQELKSNSISPTGGPSPLPKMTYEEFLDWCGEKMFAEWVDGEVILMSPVSMRHQLVAAFLAALLQHFVEAKDLGLVLTAPFQMKLVRSGREPDVLFVARERRERFTKNYLDGAADLAIEVVSPDSGTRDRRDKYREYQQAGVREYWIVDPIRSKAEFYRLGTVGAYTPILVEADGIFRSEVLAGLWLKVDWLWQESLPPLLSVLREWGLVK